MAKAKKDVRAGFFQAALDEAHKEYGSKDVYVSKDHEKAIYGIPLPCTALKYLFHSNVLPFGRLIGLAGSPGSCKSSFGFDLLRWGVAWGGISRLVETEGKLSEQAATVLGDLNKYLMIENPLSTQEAQQHITKAVDFQTKHAEGKHLPGFLLLDSLGGNEGEETMKGIRKNGYASRGFPENALIWSPYFKYLSAEIVGTKMIVAFTNHLKKKIDASGPTAQHAKTKQGGAAQDFHASYYLHLKRVRNLVSCSRYTGIEIAISVEKNSYGPGGQKISADFVWEYPYPDRPEVQVSYWDWYGATARLLMDPKTPTEVKNAVKVTCAAKKYSCPELNLKEVTAAELGMAIDTNPEMVRRLEEALHIPIRRIYKDKKVYDGRDPKAPAPVEIQMSPEFVGTVMEEAPEDAPEEVGAWSGE